MVKFCVLFLLLTQGLFAQQQLSNFRVKKIWPNALPIAIDTLTIMPNSLTVKGANKADYNFNNTTQQFIWVGNITDSITLYYRVYPFNIYGIKKLNSYDTVLQRFKIAPITNLAPNVTLFDWGNITYGGTIGRGLSFGNSQSAVLNSNLSLTLQGYLADSIAIKAQINDNNLPIQPDGSTQQLNEFDRILVQFSKNNWSIDAGDIDLRENQNDFLRFNKRVQGIGIKYKFPITKKSTNEITATGSITKGRYFRHAITPLEGNQGPYRLRGANNEVFFVVIANSERIFIDGQLLTRGFNNDYVIDYNTAEILFTNRRLISKDLRIQVEFEYADRNYVNSLFYIKNVFTLGNKLKVNIENYKNGDGKNSTINQALDQPQKQFLFNIGDSIQNAFYPISARDTLVGDKILYAKRDTLVGLFHDSVFVFSSNPNDAKYNLSFIDVGEGKGNYLPNFNGVNGRSFYWVAPINGVKKGRYEPAYYLVTPKKLQVTSVQAIYEITTKSIVNVKFARSNSDVNLFSSKDKKDNTDYASQIKHTQQFNSNKNKKLKTTFQNEFQYIGKNFVTVERIRNIEFNRDWALPALLNVNTEKLWSSQLNFTNANNNSFSATVMQYTRDKDYSGTRLAIEQNYLKKTIQFNQNIKFTKATGYGEKGVFFRPTLSLTKTFKNKFINQWNAEVLIEQNAFKNIVTDTFTAQSFAFREYRTGIKTNTSKPNSFAISYFLRENYFPLQAKLNKADRSNNLKFDAALTKNEFRQLYISTTFRNVKVFNKSINYVNLGTENALLSAIRYQFKEFKNVIDGNITYETGAGQEQRRDFTYIEVPLGQGNFYWIDYNADNIKQLNEFEPAVFPDQKQFIKLFTATNQYIKAAIASFGYQFAFNGSRLGFKTNQLGLKFLSKFSLNSFMNFNKKAIALGNKIETNPFIQQGQINNLINFNANQGHTLFYNKLSSIWGTDFSYTKYNTRSLLTYGLEAFIIESKFLKGRYQINKNFLGRMLIKQYTQTLTTPSFGNRNYLIKGITLAPEINYTYKTKWSLNGQLKWDDKENIFGVGNEKMNAVSVIVDGRYAFKDLSFLSSKITLNKINYTGVVGSTTSFIMLEALQPGRNVLWTLEFSKRLKNGLELQVSYNGRKAGNTKMIHTGNTGVVAAF